MLCCFRFWSPYVPFLIYSLGWHDKAFLAEVAGASDAAAAVTAGWACFR